MQLEVLALSIFIMLFPLPDKSELSGVDFEVFQAVNVGVNGACSFF
jgi:hypothetical protein